MIGTVLDKYEVLQKVGEGGMATVYRGRHTTLDREVAVKVLHPHLSSSTRNRKRFAREARAIEQLRHKNILEIFDYSGSSAEECYIVTEFVGGQTLTDLIGTSGPLPSEVVSLVGISLTSALAYAHQNGVLHRDLKPDNVMLREDGAVKLMDFGIARFLDESQMTMTGALVGSPAFMSPEQAKEGALDQRSDLFSLGTVLFYLSTGHFPFHGSNPSLMLRNIIEGNRPHVTDLQPGLSATLVDTIERLLQVEPNDRPTSAADVQAALQLSLDELGSFWKDTRWSVASFLNAPELYQEDLTTALKVHLLERGKEHMDAGEHLSCLRLFNRLLVLDEDNDEVLTLIQGLDTGARPKPKTGLITVALLSMIMVAGGIFWYQNRELDATPDASQLEQKLPKRAVPPPTKTDGPERKVAEVEPTRDIKTPQAPTKIQPSSDSPSAEPTLTPRKPLPENVRKAVKAILPKQSIPTAAQPAMPAFGKVEIRVVNGWGYIHVDGVATGKTTRDPEPLALPAGVHSIEIRSNNIEPYALEVTVNKDEVQRFDNIEVAYLPFTVLIPAFFPENCLVSIDGIETGVLADVTRILKVPRRINSSSVVALRCDNGIHTYTVNDTVAQKSTFPVPSGTP